MKTLPASEARPRMVALLRLAAKVGSVRTAASKLRERNEKLVEQTIAEAERVEREMLKDRSWKSYNDSCRVAAERVEAQS